jgi:hypothetical protein
MFKRLGPDALFPMLERLALDQGATSGMNEDTLTGLRVGMLEAVGSLRDPRSKSVLLSVLKNNESNTLIVRAAVEALSKLSDDDTTSALVALASAAHPSHLAVISGMGDCRRIQAANAFSQMLQARPAHEEANTLIDALGRMGSAWAWKTPAVQTHAGEEAAVRNTIAAALVQSFVQYTDLIRSNASDSLMMVDAPNTPSLIAEAKAKNPSLSAELDALQHRFEHNPTR